MDVWEADMDGVTAIPVECLRCGQEHHLLRSRHSTLDEGECPRCGYLGWAPAASPAVAEALASLPATLARAARAASAAGAPRPAVQ